MGARHRPYGWSIAAVCPTLLALVGSVASGNIDTPSASGPTLIGITVHLPMRTCGIMTEARRHYGRQASAVRLERSGSLLELLVEVTLMPATPSREAAARPALIRLKVRSCGHYARGSVALWALGMGLGTEA